MIEMQAEVGQALEQVKTSLRAEQEALQRFERLFRRSPAPMEITVLPERRFTDANDAYLKALGYTKADLIGKTAAELALSSPQHQGGMNAKLQAEGRIAEVELNFRRKDGTVFNGIFSGEIISLHDQH